MKGVTGLLEADLEAPPKSGVVSTAETRLAEKLGTMMLSPTRSDREDFLACLAELVCFRDGRKANLVALKTVLEKSGLQPELLGQIVSSRESVTRAVEQFETNALSRKPAA